MVRYKRRTLESVSDIKMCIGAAFCKKLSTNCEILSEKGFRLTNNISSSTVHNIIKRLELSGDAQRTKPNIKIGCPAWAQEHFQKSL